MSKYFLPWKDIRPNATSIRGVNDREILEELGRISEEVRHLFASVAVTSWVGRVLATRGR